MLPSFSLQRAKIHDFQDLFETESAGKLWRTHSVGCRRGKAFAKIVKAESLRQKDREGIKYNITCYMISCIF